MNTVIFIENQSGAAGRSIARKLADQLGLPYFDSAALPPSLSHRPPAGERAASRKRRHSRLTACVGGSAPCVIAGRHIGRLSRLYPHSIRILLRPDIPEGEAAPPPEPRPMDRRRYDMTVYSGVSQPDSIVERITEFCCRFELYKLVYLSAFA